MHGRALLRWSSLLVDLVALLGANVVGAWLRANTAWLFGVKPMPFALDWSYAVYAVSVVGAFYATGLYEREAYVSRPLHLWAVLRASVAAFVLSALAVYLLKTSSVEQSRLVLSLTFFVFFVFVVTLRLGILDLLYVGWVRRHRPVSFLIGDSREAQNLADRLADLRGFAQVERIPPDALRPAVGDSFGAMLDERSSHREPADAVFIDTMSVSPREVFDVTGAAMTRGVAVYVLSGLLGPLEGSRLLNVLFQAPVIRVRRSLENANAHLFKRVFDILGASLLLLAAAPVVAILAIAIRLSSPGPVFYRQVRAGRFGVPFDFFKFRSMVVNADASSHAGYVKAFMHGTAEPVSDGAQGEGVFKQVDDPRITRVGRFIRKYSLDEIPQFWNVLRGDMSLVGPRPPLQYEVEEYDDWHMARLLIPPGVTGMWQVEGRSRVSFDEMILQDLMYAKNMRLVVDVSLCVRTVPAVLLGYGGG